ncbi:probable poly(ADP-ribose) glycohydrolase 2 isoform X2 [Selaginella moellendorffii]|uniref:probable poly(ADP-ribose) glycohydrolase 2 isoform X2 n=1 Tax=Selaginella moellendorffii TaxID=88036 RepID=UPI000D1CEFFF|nr:probable poly(ADP-ribose) glycohydrolase 2 isoform X2 [Selaginella moellendorffii]|eukprot:XP_024526394.1 probable poly(ADP-ribose) glycohydrolase 2 isoform X2 [Selaginella moellendorffii]
MGMAPLLPLTLDEASKVLEWPIGVSMALSELAQGPAISRVSSGEALLDYIVEMRHRGGMRDAKLPARAVQGMGLFFRELVPEDFCRGFFGSLLPAMAQLALRLSALVKDHIDGSVSDRFPSQLDFLQLRALPAGQSGMVLLSQELVASILACGFFCLYPSAERNKLDLPDLNFYKLFMALVDENREESAKHKIICLLHYFQIVCESVPQGMISYERKVLSLEQEMEDPLSFWSSSSRPLCQILVMEDGTIEGSDTPVLEVDFANRVLGGGVLGAGCLQEEIRCVINPELIAGRLFLPAMQDNEAIEIVGTQCYNRYEGYASSFRFAGKFFDNKARDAWGRKETHIVAIDALPFPGEAQFDAALMLRELNKAYCGFLVHQSIQCGGSSESARGVATGNWGCGVFGGDHEVKSMLQWLAASEVSISMSQKFMLWDDEKPLQAGRPFLLYYTFKDPRTTKLQRIADWILEQKWSVLELWSVLIELIASEDAELLALIFP